MPIIFCFVPSKVNIISFAESSSLSVWGNVLKTKMGSSRSWILIGRMCP